MALSMDCINVFYQPNDLIILLSMVDELFTGKLNIKQFNLILKWFNIKSTNLW